MSDHFDKLRAAIAQAEARALPPMDADQLLRDLRDQVLDPTKRNRLRTLLQALIANKTEPDMESVTQAFLEQAPAVVGADLWRQCCEKQRPRGDPVPDPPDQPAASGGGEDAIPPDAPSDDPWRCNGCQASKTSKQRRRGPEGPKTLCNKCYRRWRRGETGPRRRFECRWCNATSTGAQWAGPTGEADLCHSCGQTYDRASLGVKALIFRLDTKIDRLKSENERLTSVPVFDVDAGTETRGPPPKRATRHVKIRLKIGGASVQEGGAELVPLPCALTGARATGAPLGGKRWGAVGQPLAAPFTDALQTKIDELHALARQVDPVAADAIKNRQAT